MKVLPRPSSLSTRISPPCAATIWRAMDSPTPVPFGFDGRPATDKLAENRLLLGAWNAGAGISD